MSFLEENALFTWEWLIWYSCYTDNFSWQNGYQINRNPLYSPICINKLHLFHHKYMKIFIWHHSFSAGIERGVEEEAQRAAYCAPEYNIPPFWGISQGGHVVFPIGPKNTNLVEDVEILLPVKFRWIPFSGFREEVKNVSANQRPGQPSCFSYRPEKQKLGRGCWDLASY